MHVCIDACMDVFHILFINICVPMHILNGALMHPYICTYVCMHVCMYVCIHMSVCMYVRRYVCNYLCMYVCMYVCTYVCLFACTCVCMYVFRLPSKSGTVVALTPPNQCTTRTKPHAYNLL